MRTSGTRIASLIAVGAVVASVLSVVSSPTRRDGAATASPVSEAPDAASATLAAHGQGSAVEVLDQRTSMRRVFANPGGGMTTELNAVPVRVKRGSTWVPIDTTVVERSDGLVGPRAAVGDAVFSGGGSTAALASLHRDGRKLSLHWPGELPKPALSANTATYREVLPGVDLVMRAERDGLQQHMVVKTREAAKNPALASIRMGMRADGLDVGVSNAGSLQAFDGTGNAVFTAPPATMWDSTGRTTRFDVSVVDGVLMLSPDRGFLADPAVVYPVTIDPPWKVETFQRNAWATVLAGYPNDHYWWTSGEPGLAQVGQCYRVPGNDRCNGIGEAWAYFQFDTGFLHDKKVRSITFNTAAVYSPSCESRRHVLHESDTAIGWPGPTWNSRPDGRRIAEFDAPLARGGCDANRGIGIELGGYYNPRGLSAYSIRARDWNDQFAWRKYRPEETTIRVEWNRAPNPPDELTTDPPLREPCHWCGGNSYVGDASIRLMARLSDPDNDPVDPQWAIDRTRADGVAEPRQHVGWGLGFSPSGERRSLDLNLSADHGKTIAWHVRTGDGSEHTGDWRATPRTFVVDRRGITAEPAVSSPAYPEDNAWHGGVGVPGMFTFSPGAPCDANNTHGTCDIDHYEYGWEGGSVATAVANALGGSATVSLAPPGDGPRILHVRSVDRANHHSPAKAYRFYVRAGNGPRSQWSFDGNANDTAFLGDRHGTLNGSARIGSGAVGTALTLNATAGSDMTAPTTVRTDASFSVAAWVKLDRTDSGWYTAVSQDGTSISGFTLQYEGDTGQWVFVLPGSETPQEWYFVRADKAIHPPVAGAWTHLAGTFDAVNRRINLYVNGVLAGTAQRNTLWHAPGLLRVGSARSAGRQENWWPGAIDEVQIYDRVISLGEIRAAVSRDNVRAGHWTFDDKDGATAANSVEAGDALVLKEGARFIDGGAVKRAVSFDGVNDHAVTARSVVRTDRSFTVAAWVKADRFVTGGASQTAVSQDGNRNSGFYLQYNSGVQKWVFLRFSHDTDVIPDGGWVGLQASQAPTTGAWTHLAGTFNAADRKMTIYVNGQYGGETIFGFDSWDATGPLTVGRAKRSGAPIDYWPGAVDEVRMYNRALSQPELEGIVSRNDVPAASWKLDGNAVDDGANHRDGVLNGNPAWTSGQSENPDPQDLAISLDGTDDYVKAPAVVNTTQSYSVSAWVRLGQRRSGWQAVASQAGQSASAFTLGYSGTDGTGGVADRWALQIAGPDRNDPETTRVNSATPAQIGVWTHLAAVYQASSGEIWLYVNGIESGYERLNGKPTFNAQLEFDIGRAKWNGGNGSPFSGAVDDVKVYSRPLFDDEIRLMAGRDLPLVHNWRLDEPSGTGAADHVGGRPGTVSGDAARIAGRAGNAVRFNGTAVVRTTAVDVATDQRFTVSAWVNLDRPGVCEEVCQWTAVSVDSGQSGVDSKFRLGHRIDQDQAPGPYGKWIFEMPERDGTITEAAISAEPGQFNAWVFLVGVYDAPAGQYWLYVYSSPNAPDFDSGTLQTPWRSTGGLRLGASVRGGQAADHWRGSIDDVRLFTGDLDADRIGALYRSYPTTAPSPTSPVPGKGHWRFDENTGTTAADSSGREQTATLQGGAGWNAGGRIGATNWFDGTTGFAQTAGSIVDTTESFSVSAWAYLSTGDGGPRTVFAQDGDSVSAFSVQYQPDTRRWKVVVPDKDEPNATTKEVVSTGPPMVSPWTHLVISYDKPLGQVRLYVNGQVPEAGVGLAPLKSTGPFSIGRGKRNGANFGFFPGAVDDVRVFGHALSDGQVRRIHDDAPPRNHGYWEFEGNLDDTSWRHNPTTGSGGISYGTGVRGQGLLLDGVSTSASTAQLGVNMLDSFTVSAWAMLASAEHDATVVSQDGTRMSGFLLQYNKNANRWIFGAAPDADFGQLVYAHSPEAPKIGRWTHLAGVYDYPARQLRLYVDGELVGTKNDAPLWPTVSGLSIGRSKENGVPADFFKGSLDKVQIDFWTVPDAEIAQRASWPAPAGGQLGRFLNDDGDHYTANSTGSHDVPFGSVPAGYRFEGPLGRLLTAELPNTRKLYACMNGTDEFTSADPVCGGAPATKLADLGWVYTAPQADVPTLALYRCATTIRPERFDSLDPNCEGMTWEAELGHTIAYMALTRYVHKPDWERTTTTLGAKPGYQYEGTLGLVATTAVAGTRTLWNCRDGLDEFVTTDPTCAGKTPVGGMGRLWTEAPPGMASRSIYLCQATNGDRFNSIRADCEGNATAPAVQIGYALTSAPPSSAPQE